MKEIIYKQDRKVIAICPHCGTVFSYTKEDISETQCLNDAHSGVFLVTCPVCENELYVGDVDKQLQYIYPPQYLDQNTGKIRPYWWDHPAEPIPCKNDNLCENCGWFVDIKRGKTIVGDYPCQWCDKNPYKVLCSDLTTSTTRIDTDTIITAKNNTNKEN